MDQLNLALSMIVEENEPVDIIKRAFESIQNVIQGAYITVTYKNQQPEKSPLIDYLKSKNVNVSFFKWTYRFDDARNFAASQIPKDFLYYVWMDADDLWYNPFNIPQLLKDAYINNQTAIFMDYWYLVELDEQKNVKEILVQHKRERIIKNDGSYKWMGKLHETLIGQKQFGLIQVYRPEAFVIHLTTSERAEKALDRNIQILEQSVKEEQRKDPRTIMYLAKAYYDRSRMEKPDQAKIDGDLAEGLFAEYLTGSGQVGVDYRGGSGWSDERSTAWQYLGELYRGKGQLNRAIKATVNSMIEAPHFPQYYLDMSLNYVLSKEWQKAENWLIIGKNMPTPVNTTLILTPRDTKARMLEIEYHLAMAKNDLNLAYESAKGLAALFPNLPDMQNRFKQAEDLKVMNKASQSLVFLGKYLEATGETEKIIPLVQSISKNLQQEQFVAQMRHKFLPPRIWKKDEIAIVCGPGFEKWSPKTIDQGLGGSEAAVIYNARELVKLGYKVTVYGDPQDEAGEYDGVNYLSWYQLNFKDVFNILILWRAVGFVDNPFYARKTYLWAHDVPTNADFTEDRLKKINKIFVLSDYHRSLFKKYLGNDKYVDIEDDKFLVTRNGIVPYIPDQKVKRDFSRMIYASSYDRGLVHLLLIWPEIRKEVPDANLHIFYGWNTFDAIMRGNPERQFWKKKMIEMMQQPGVTEHGRVGHKALGEEFLKSGIFAYPTDFQEISCQNAMQAQVYGAIPITSNYAALKETVKFGKKLDIDITSKEGKDIYIKTIIKALKDHDWQQQERIKMMEETKEMFLWQDVAKQWDELFKEKKKEVI